ncbi:TrkA family potassium uptake protein [candidate division WOR-3 bacterium]|nr:TrkA family potassium uptake protein [candidate division WOR-3 bacterium]
MRQFAVIGLGTFGARVARTLMEKGAEVIAIDADPKRVEAIKDDVTQALCLDSTDEEALAHSGVLDVDAVVVAMGERMEAAIITTSLLKKLGAGQVIARAASSLFARILKDVGADRTILIEEQMADHLAKSLITPDLLEQIPLTSNHSLIEMHAPRHMIGKKLGKLDIRRRYGVNIIAIKKKVPVITPEGESSFKEQINDLPGPDDIIEQDDILVVVGNDEDIERLAQGAEPDARKKVEPQESE